MVCMHLNTHAHTWTCDIHTLKGYEHSRCRVQGGPSKWGIWIKPQGTRKNHSKKERRGTGRSSVSGENRRNGLREVVWLPHGMMGAGEGKDAIFFHQCVSQSSGNGSNQGSCGHRSPGRGPQWSRWTVMLALWETWNRLSTRVLTRLRNELIGGGSGVTLALLAPVWAAWNAH